MTRQEIQRRYHAKHYVPTHLLPPEQRERRVAAQKEKARAWYLAHKEETCAKVRAYRQDHLDEVQAREKAYKAAHKEEGYARTRAWALAHPEAVKVSKRRSQQAHLPARNAQRRLHRQVDLDLRERERLYRASTKPAAAARMREWRKRNLEHARANDAAWKKAHPLKGREQCSQRRARRRQVFVEKVELLVLYERDKGICGICKKKLPLAWASFDHILPLAQGGEHSYKNMQIAHLSCNSRKRDRATIPQQLRLVG